MKVEGLSGRRGARGGREHDPGEHDPGDAPLPSRAAASKTSAKTEAKEATEAKAIEKAPLAEAVKVSSTKLKKLGNTTGKKHDEEVNKLGDQPIETGG